MKTKVFGSRVTRRKISVKGIEIENSEKFTYLRSNITHDLDCKKEISDRIARALASLTALERLRKNKSISLQTKLSVLMCMHVKHGNDKKL